MLKGYSSAHIEGPLFRILNNFKKLFEAGSRGIRPVFTVWLAFSKGAGNC